MMPIGNAKANDQAQLRARLDEWAKATRAKDIDAIMSYHAPDVRSFDCHSQLQLKGTEAYRKHLEACLPCIQGPMIFEIHDLDITAQDDLAFGHYLARCGGTGADGREHIVWLRATVCLRRMSGKWMILHDHLSAPFDPESGKAMLDLEAEPAERASAA
jgi:uncharacterized protein (TIGR02246 family)